MNASYLYFLVGAIVGVFLPIYGILAGSKVRELLTNNPKKLISEYRNVMLLQFALVILILLSLYFNEDSIDEIWLAFLWNPLHCIYLIGISLLFFWLMHSISFSNENVEKLRAKYSKVDYLMPKNALEYRFAIVLSFIVGICEEIIYRGFLYWQLTLYLPFLIALLITNLIFGLLHWGTGLENAISTVFLGLIYSALSIYFNSLWPAILAHICTDIYAVSIGYKLYRAEL